MAMPREDGLEGLPDINEALYWIYKCAATDEEESGVSPGAVRKAFGRWIEDKPPRNQTGFSHAKRALEATAGIEKQGAWEFGRFADEYDQLRRAFIASTTPEALWQALNGVLVPLWADRLTKLNSRDNPVGYIFGEERPCPLRGEIGNDRSVAANIWWMPERQGKTWDTPVAKVIRRTLKLTGTSKEKVALFAEKAPSETSGSSPYDAWKQQLHRWAKPWCADDSINQRPTIPRPESIRQFVALLDRMVGLDVASEDGLQPANAFHHYLKMDESGRADYVQRYYAESEPQHLEHAREHKARIAAQVSTFAEENGALTSKRLLAALMVARAVQSACFGIDSYTKGLRHLAATQCGEAEADRRMAELRCKYEKAVRRRAERHFGSPPELYELIDRVG